jgi:hypothetical protein
MGVRLIDSAGPGVEQMVCILHAFVVEHVDL